MTFLLHILFISIEFLRNPIVEAVYYISVRTQNISFWKRKYRF